MTGNLEGIATFVRPVNMADFEVETVLVPEGPFKGKKFKFNRADPAAARKVMELGG